MITFGCLKGGTAWIGRMEFDEFFRGDIWVVFVVLEEAEGFDVIDAGDGLAVFGAAACVGMLFVGSSRTLLKIGEVSGLTVEAVVFFAASAFFCCPTNLDGKGVGGGVLIGIFWACAESAADFVEVALARGVFRAAAAVAFVVLDATALVDFWRVVVFFGVSVNPDDAGSGATFFGLPFFLTTSEDIL